MEIVIGIVLAGLLSTLIIVTLLSTYRSPSRRSDIEALIAENRTQRSDIEALIAENRTQRFKVEELLTDNKTQRRSVESLELKGKKQLSEIKSLIVKNRNLKNEAVNRYEHDIDSLIREVSQTIESSRNRIKYKAEKAINELDLKGFKKFSLKEKIEEFERYTLQPIWQSESQSIQKELASLGDRFYRSENIFEDRLKKILENLKMACRGLDIPAPDIKSFEVKKTHRLDKILEGVTKEGKYVSAAAVSAVTILGFSQNAMADPISDTTIHGADHALGHGGSHALGHGISHTMGHGLAHSAGHVIGLAVPFLNIALIGFSAYKLGNFFFDDSEIKDKMRSQLSIDVDRYYDDLKRKVANQLYKMKDKFRYQTENIFEDCGRLTLDALARQIENER